jgi:hypothetical protein
MNILVAHYMAHAWLLIWSYEYIKPCRGEEENSNKQYFLRDLDVITIQIIAYLLHFLIKCHYTPQFMYSSMHRTSPATKAAES